MLMVCPNCHSHRIIQVQDQFFCINCGQMIPNPDPAAAAGKVAVAANGLPEGVKILAPSGAEAPEMSLGDGVKVSVPDSAPVVAAADTSGPLATIVRPRHRISFKSESTAAAVKAGEEPKAEVKPDQSSPQGEQVVAAEAKSMPKRKRGRPKAGPLDTPLAEPVTPVPSAPAAAIASAAPVVRRMSDISPRPLPKPVEREHVIHKPTKTKPKHNSKLFADLFGHKTKPKTAAKERGEEQEKEKSKAKPRHKSVHHVHKVGVAPLHYGVVLGDTLRAHTHKNYLFWGLVSVAGFALAMGYAAWLYFSVGPKELARHLMSPGLLPVIELATLAVLYYIGRSIGQTAIMYGIIRHADERPISLGRQFGVAVNTFGRRLRLDLACAVLNLILIWAIGLLVVTGGTSWSVSGELQLIALFCAFLFLLYLMSALAMSRGLANIALTTTTRSVWQTVKLGWKLFSHRFELLGFRFVALGLELLICLPLAALALVILIMAPPAAHLLATLGVALIAVVSGTLMGVGTAAWWATLYRRIVLTDRQPEAVQLLASRQPNDAHRGNLAFIVSVVTLLVCLAAALPWLKFV